MAMIYLIGFTGVGKTTIGKKLALQKNKIFYDVDNEIEIEEKNNISNIFKLKGELCFREIETKILKKAKNDSIVSCGGGLPTFKDNMTYIKENGISIYLKASEDDIFKRLSKNLSNRPLVKNMNNKELKLFVKIKIKERERFYRLADYTINTSNYSIDEILVKINSLLVSS